MWRRKRWIGVGLVALAVAATAAAIGGFATGGKAASTNTCPPTSTTNPPTSSCFSLVVLPNSYLTVSKTGLAIAEFANTLGTATANHVVITFTGLSGVSATAISASVPGPCSLQTLSCSLGSVPGGATVRVFLRFTAPSTPQQVGPLTATLGFDESNGNTGSPGNDTIQAISNQIVVVAPGTRSTPPQLQGLCQATVSATNPLSLNTVSDRGQQTKLSTSSAADSLPCTPASAGIESALAPPGACGGNDCTTQLSFVFFPTLLNSAFATVVLDFPASELPDGTTPATFTLWEFLPGSAAQTVPDCPNQTPDACIFLRQKFQGQGVELVLHVFGTPVDGHFGG